MPLPSLTLSLFAVTLCVVSLAKGQTEEPEAALKARLAKAATDEMEGNILPFWTKNSPNPANGGFYGAVGFDLKPKAKEMRGSLLTSRILWTYAAAYRLKPSPETLEMAKRAAADLRDHFWDPEFGGSFWAIKADGKPLMKEKHTYGQAFSLYAFSEYYRATGESWAKEYADKQYQLLEAHARDRVHGGYWEACTQDWKVAPPSRHNQIGAPSPKSQNTNLHVMEALANYYRISPTPEAAESLRAEVLVMMEKITDPLTHHLSLFQAADWKPFDDKCSYGHDIEYAWLLTESTELLGDKVLHARAEKLAIEIADTTLREGVDVDGGIWEDGTPKGGVEDRTKEWWPQAEAVVGFLNAYQISGDSKYLRAAAKTWAYIETHIIDHKGGEWHRIATTDERLIRHTPKISFWKCPYHNSRACMEIAARLK